MHEKELGRGGILHRPLDLAINIFGEIKVLYGLGISSSIKINIIPIHKAAGMREK